MQYESKIVAIQASAEQIFPVLSNLENLNRAKENASEQMFSSLIPGGIVSDVSFDADSVRMKIDGLGQKVCVRIVEREPNKTIKFGADNIPMEMNFWIQLKQVSETDTRMRLVLKVDLPMMFKMMFEKKIQTGLDAAADSLAQIPFAAVQSTSN